MNTGRGGVPAGMPVLLGGLFVLLVRVLAGAPGDDPAGTGALFLLIFYAVVAVAARSGGTDATLGGVLAAGLVAATAAAFYYVMPTATLVAALLLIGGLWWARSLPLPPPNVPLRAGRKRRDDAGGWLVVLLDRFDRLLARLPQPPRAAALLLYQTILAEDTPRFVASPDDAQCSIDGGAWRACVLAVYERYAAVYPEQPVMRSALSFRAEHIAETDSVEREGDLEMLRLALRVEGVAHTLALRLPPGRMDAFRAALRAI